MATGTDVGAAEGFGQVSRTVGRVFRAVLFVATVVGLLALAILLAYVFNDAVRPLTADPGWYVVYGLALVVPTAAVGVALSRRDDRAFRVGATALAVPALGLLFGSGAALLFVDIISPILWLAYYLAVTLPIAFAVALARSDRDVSFLAWLGASAVAFVVSALVVPGLVTGLPALPTDGLIMAGTVGGPAALLVRWFVAGRWEDQRTGDVAGLAAFAGVVVASFAGPLVGLTGVPATLLATFVGVPTGVYVATTYVHRPADRSGLLLPAVVVVGLVVAELGVGVVGVAGPNSWVDWQFLTTGHNNDATAAGLYPAIAGTIMLMLIVALVSFPLGVGAAVYLEEYAPDNRLTRVVRVNIANLAGVPSVVYGILGLGVFVSYLGSGIPIPPPVVADALGVTPTFVGKEVLSAGTVLVGGLTLSLLILPIIIIASQEAVRSVPEEYRQASYGMGATRWQTVRNVVLPRAFPGILTGTILALGRAIGETAPLIVIAAPNVFDLPTALGSSVGAMPLQVYAWATVFAMEEFWYRAVPAGVVVMLVTLLAMNSIAIALRNKYQIDW